MNHIVGIDVGGGALRAVEVRNSDRANPTIIRYAEVPLPGGSVRRGEVLEVGTVTTALKRLWSTGGFGTKDVVLGIGGPRVLSRDLTVAKGTLGQIREALPFQVQDMLPVPVAEVLLDFYPISETLGESGPVVNGLLVAAIKEAVTANVAAATKAGLRPVQVDLIPFALVRALARGAAGLTAVVSIGANTTNVVLVQDGVPQFVRIVPAGGDDITRALATRMQLDQTQAEAAKRQLGFATGTVSPEHLPFAEVIYTIGLEQLNAIHSTLSYYTNTKPGSVIDRIVLSGGGAQLGGLAGALGELTGITVVTAEPLGGAALARHPKGTQPTREQADAMTTAYALALGSVA